jgi:hypothetical protein
MHATHVFVREALHPLLATCVVDAGGTSWIPKDGFQGVFWFLAADPTTLGGTCESIHASLVPIWLFLSLSFPSFSSLDYMLAMQKIIHALQFLFFFYSIPLLLIAIVLFTFMISNCILFLVWSLVIWFFFLFFY